MKDWSWIFLVPPGQNSIPSFICATAFRGPNDDSENRGDVVIPPAVSGVIPRTWDDHLRRCSWGGKIDHKHGEITLIRWDISPKSMVKSIQV